MKPFLKWVGGKHRLYDYLNTIFQYKRNRVLVEPFVGAGSIFLNYYNLFDNIIINDSNKKLINCYIQIRDNVEEIIEILSSLKSAYYSQEGEYVYNKVKETFNKINNSVYAAAFFIFLNKTCFNGLYRVNRKGEFNVAFGKYAKPTIFDNNNLKQISNLLRYVQISSVDFRKLEIPSDSCVYFDPPYYQQSDNAFTSYTKESFSWNDHVMLKNLVLDIDKKGIEFVYSNGYFSEVKQWFKNFYIREVKINRLLSQDGYDRFQDKEILVTNISM